MRQSLRALNQMKKSSLVYPIMRSNEQELFNAGKYFQEKHAEFLSIAKNNGEGNIIVNFYEKNKENPYNISTKFNTIELIIKNSSARNAFSGNMMYQLSEAIVKIDNILKEGENYNKNYQNNTNNYKKNEYVSLLIRGEGTSSFCSGADLNFAKKNLPSPSQGLLMSKYMTDILNYFRQLNLIVVIGLNGPVVGGGTEVASVGDFRIGTRWVDSESKNLLTSNDLFLQYIHARLGAAPGWGGAARLTKIVGRNTALKWSISGNRISAKEAEHVGFFDKVYDIELNNEEKLIMFQTPSPSSNSNDTSVLESKIWIEKLNEFLLPYVEKSYPGSIRAIKSSIAGVEWLNLEEQQELESKNFESRWFGEDQLEVLNKKK